ncbi:MAG: PQQ-like beta-propeller repeat protein [Sedimentisphaerales bacterium]|nr:PQQ-like beta-propeller repeat protein [Sedimentisphaerales bacterium]
MNLEIYKLVKFPALASFAVCLFTAFSISLLDTHPARAEDWPTYMHDNARSGITTESLDLEKLNNSDWVYTSPMPPQVAWGTGQPWDSWYTVSQVPMRDFDFAFFVTVVDDRLYFGSSVTDSVHCLDVQTGEQLWFYRTKGPVRFPPTVYDGKLYFGSDDGYAYCIDASNQNLIWKFRPVQDDRLLCNNSKLIPMYPIRTGTAVIDDKVYFAASLVPWKSSYLCSVDALTGSSSGTGLYVSSGGSTPMAAILVSPTKIYLTQGNRYPYVFNRSNGSSAGTLGTYGDGGCYALLTSDTGYAYGHGQLHASGYELRVFNDTIATQSDGRYMVVSGDKAYVLFGNKLKAINRSGGATVWENTSCDCPYALIMADNILFAGGNNQVKAYSASNGQELWSGTVNGHARGLAVADQRLFVSTDAGNIHMFGDSFLPEDFNKNGTVDLPDLMMILNTYLNCTNPNDEDCDDLLGN